jgi:transmembrane sensor
MSEIDTIIQKYLQGKTSEEENQQLHQGIQQSPENKKRLFIEKDIWDSYGFHSNQKKYETRLELELLKKHIEDQKPYRYVQFNRIIPIAAILLIAFGLGWSSQFISFSPNSQISGTTMQEIFVPKGQVNQIFLSDGTRIWINSESRLSLPSVFASNERVVKLNGEAFFEVAKDKDRPFIVDVKGQQIKVFGTSFNVRAYDNSNKIETTLETGSIQLHIGNQTTMLKPGEQSLFNKTENQLAINRVDAATFSSWKDGRFEFQNEDLIEVFKVVERWYDVDITYDKTTFSGMHFSGVIKRNKDARYFLEILSLSVPIRYKINSDNIIITSK